MSLAEKDRKNLIPLAKKIDAWGITIYATEGTSKVLNDNNIKNTVIKKLHEGRPNIADAIVKNELQLIINTPIGKDSKFDDSYIRMMAIQRKIPYVTSIAAAEASIQGIEAVKNGMYTPKSLQEYHQALL
ncbi:MAG: hypothetical protein GKB99_03380 [Methanocellales archaeon]|nr:hypothetical protein [Methanocellales archaeon]